MPTKRERVSEWAADVVARRDGYKCVAPSLDGRAGWCRDKWGHVITRWPARRIDPDKVTYAHVKDRDGQAMSMKAKSDPNHLLLLCWGHHEGTGAQAGYCWGTSRVGLEKQRTYLEETGHLSPRTPIL